MAKTQQDLDSEGYQLADEIRDGKWKHIPGVEMAASCPAIVDELRKRCPGFSTSQYQRAIADGLFDSR